MCIHEVCLGACGLTAFASCLCHSPTCLTSSLSDLQHTYNINFLCTRAQLEQAKQAREEAERQKKELAERLHKFEMETKRAEEGMYLM